MKVVLVDWLGRGGIAQATMSWRRALHAAGARCTVVTRAGRELPADVAPPAAPRMPVAAPLLAHRAVAQTAARTIRSLRPELVVVQNYIVPPLEWPVYRAARLVGARVVTVVHDDRLHSRLAGTGAGLQRALQASDVVMAHSVFVADRLGASASIRVVPLPVQRHMVEADGQALWPRTDAPLAVHFGVLKRRYKGTLLVVRLAASPATRPWRFGVLGAGAPPPGDRLHSSGGYVPTGALVATVRAADAVVLPYTFATQSGAVVLAQALGTPCVVSAVGGIPEQVQDGATGRLVPAGSDLRAWTAILSELYGDSAARRRLADTARRAAYARDGLFTAEVTRLVAEA